MTDAELIERAERAFIFDARHHAEVKTAVDTIERNAQRRLSPVERALAEQAASAAIVVTRARPLWA